MNVFIEVGVNTVGGGVRLMPKRTGNPYIYIHVYIYIYSCIAIYIQLHIYTYV